MRDTILNGFHVGIVRFTMRRTEAEEEDVILEQEERQEIRKENIKKKKYLRGYRKHRNRVRRIQAEIEEIKYMKTHPSINNNGMPHGNKQNDLSDYVAKLDELEEKLYKEGIAQLYAYKNIDRAINTLQNENERDVLFYRYIKDMEFWEIAKEMGYSESWIFKIHEKALRHLKKTEEDSSV